MTEFLVTLAAGFTGYLLARRLVSRRLRFVDAVQSRFGSMLHAVDHQQHGGQRHRCAEQV